jgi:hypothetical protein
VSGSSFTRNSASVGGGLDNFGTARVSGSSFTRNSASVGGGLDNKTGAMLIDGGGNTFKKNSPVDVS